MHFCVFSFILPLYSLNKYLLSIYDRLSIAPVPRDTKLSRQFYVFVRLFLRLGTILKYFKVMNFKYITHLSILLPVEIWKNSSNLHSRVSNKLQTSQKLDFASYFSHILGFGYARAKSFI